MDKFKNIKAILFDAGHTLNRPRTGHWFITPKFYEILDEQIIKSNLKEFNKALDKEYQFLNENHNIKTEKEEFLQFKDFYKMILEDMKYPNITDKIINALAEDVVYNDEKFEFFEDVEETMKELKGNYLLGVVSDTWPSLERVFRNQGLRDYYSTFVMSSVYGSFKAEKKLFNIALHELNVQAKESLFVDDGLDNVIAAKQMGFNVALINRYPSLKSSLYNVHSKITFKKMTNKNLRIITSLAELKGLLEIK